MESLERQERSVKRLFVRVQAKMMIVWVKGSYGGRGKKSDLGFIFKVIFSRC